jgi:MYXO-CTERM domain-containing protein
MPWAERIEEYAPGGGAPIVLADESATIDALIDEWNAVANCNGEGGSGSSDTGLDDGDGGIDPDDGDGDGVGGGTSTSGSTSGGEPGANDESLDDGCACTTIPGATGWMLMLLGAAARRRRS